MKVIYLHHSGFLVELEKSTLVFDAITNIPPHFLKRGHKTYYFATHNHKDHFSQSIFGCGAVCNEYNTWFVLSDDIPKKGQANITYVKPYQSFTLDGEIEVKTFGSTDAGVSFLVKAEGKTFFHAGDLNWWDWTTEERPNSNPLVEEADFKAEVAKIKADGSAIDIAFFPTDSRLGNSACRGPLWFIDEIHPKNLAPMHFWDDYALCEVLQTKAFGKGTRILDITKRNEIIFEA